LNSQLERLRQLDTELVAAQQARYIADEAERVPSEHESVRRWMKAGSLARQGFGYDFESAFSPWYLSGKEQFAGAPECTNWFMRNLAIRG
jgi:hypothetical protein